MRTFKNAPLLPIIILFWITMCCTQKSMSSSLFFTYLHAKCKYSNDYFEDQCQGQLPHGCVHPNSSWPVWNVIYRPSHVGVIDVVTELGGFKSPTVVKQLRNELTGTLTSVRIGIGDDGSDGCHHNDLQHWILPQSGSFTPPAPGNVAACEEGSPQTPKDSKQDEREEFGHIPGCMILHIKENQATISKGVDGAQCESRYQCCEK